MSLLLQIDFSNLPTTSDEFSKLIYSFPVTIRILFGVILFFGFVITMLFAIIIGSRIYKTRAVLKRAEIKNKYQPVITELLFEDDERLLSDGFLSLFDVKDLTIKFHREILLDEVIHIHENFTGETAARVELLFRKLNLHLDSLAKLKNPNWYVIAKGLRELSLMNIHEAYDDILAFISSKNDVLRMEARIALVKLSKKDHLSFLEKETETLSAWDQANLHAMLIKLPKSNIPDFTVWLKSENKSVVEFCVRMIGAFQQNESIPVLINTLSSKDNSLRKVAMKSLAELHANQAEEKLNSIYFKEDIELQHEILVSLEVMATEKSIPLFEKILKQPVTDYSTCIHAVRALLATGQQGKLKLQQISANANDKLKHIIQHASDPRL